LIYFSCFILIKCEMVKTLVQSGAELSENDFGLSAIDSVINNNNSDVVEFLVRYYNNLDKIYQ